MGRPPCCDKSNVKRGLWTAEEDAKILAYVSNHGIGNWTLVPKKAGLNRCGKSCRLRWTNYLRPDLKHDNFTPQEEQLILDLHKAIGSRWSLIAKRLPGRTDNDVKNYWNTKLKKKLVNMGIDPVTHKPFSQIFLDYSQISSISSPNTNANQFPSFNNNNNNNMIMVNSQPQPSAASSSSVLLSNKNEVFFVMQPQFLNEVSSSCCSSSSPSNYTQTPLPNVSSSCLWNEFLQSDPVDFQQQEKDNNNNNNNDDDDDDEFFNGGFIQVQGNHFGGGGGGDASSSSFVDGILDKDRELGSQFPQLLDSSFDY